MKSKQFLKWLNVRPESPLIMAILNVTPDSFSDGGTYYSKDKAIDHALKMEQDGADIIDIGGESTRPGADHISDAEEVTGSTHRRWDGLNDFDRYVGSGVYVYVFEYEDDNGKKNVIKKPIGVVK